MSNVCIHGGLRRKCDICDLEAENAELKEENARMRKALEEIANDQCPMDCAYYRDTTVVLAREALSGSHAEPTVKDSLTAQDGVWWCNTHQREATHTDLGSNGAARCNPKLGGIMIPCRVVFAPVEIQPNQKDVNP